MVMEGDDKQECPIFYSLDYRAAATSIITIAGPFFRQVTSPHKVGEGMSSYMVYDVSTRTNVNYFKKKEMAVSRRFSDFLGLHDKLSEKYLQNGRIIPPAPDKSVVGMTKVKMSKESAENGQDEVSATIFGYDFAGLKT